MSIEAMKQALEALNSSDKLINGTETKFGLEGAMDGYYRGCFDIDGNNVLLKSAITSLRQAIAEAEKQEPVAWRGYNWSHSPDDWVYRDFDDPILDGNGNNVGQPLYTSPPQRQPLTDEHRSWIVATCLTQRHIIDAVEAAHGIKGEA